MYRASKFIALIVMGLTLYSNPSKAGVITRDCYVFSGVPEPKLPSESEIFIFVDQTTVLNDELKQMVIDRASDYLADGRGFTVAKFSSFLKDQVTNVTATGKIQMDLTRELRGGLPRPTVRNFDSCKTTQLIEAQGRLAKELINLMNKSDSNIIRSDIIDSMISLSRMVRESTAQKKVVFLISDMLENSARFSFYGKGREINEEQLIAKLKETTSFADFGRAKIVILGAGVVSSTTANQQSYQDKNFLLKLEGFWRNWFSRSNALVDVFGTPSVINPIK